jgi:hypothetical protein
MTANDINLLAELDSKMAVVRDRTRSVVLGYTTGFYLYGKLYGRSDNHPVYATDVSYGDVVAVQEDEIVAVMQPETTT